MLDSEFDEFPAAFSPDGRWIAYVSNETGDSAVYVSRFTGTPGARPRGKVRVSPGPGLLPRWRGDGGELFYYAADEDALMAVSVDGSGDVFQVGPPRQLFRFGGRLSGLARSTDYVCDVTPDGERILALLSGPDEGEGAEPITVVSNWLGSAR